MRSRPAEAANYEFPYRNNGGHYTDGNNHHGTDGVWGVHRITRKNKGDKVTQQVNRTQSPFGATKGGPRKRCSPKAAQGGLLGSFFTGDKDNKYNTTKSS